MSQFSPSRRSLVLSTAGLSGCCLLAGCSSVLTPSTASQAAIAVTGNWQLSSASVAAVQLPALSGELTGSSRAMTGIFHSDSASACVKPNQAVEVSGAADANNLVTLTGTGLAGGKLTIQGTLAADGKSLTHASYTVTGGTCGFAKPADASAQQYSSINGTYTGSFTDGDGQSVSLNATLSQSPASDTDGNFELTGSGTFSDMGGCFVSPVNNVNSMVTGGTFNLTYADQTTGNSVNLTGTFSQDGRTLTISQWTLTGPCGPDTGTGLLTQ